MLDTGTRALARAIAEGRKLKVVAFRVGTAANFEPSTTAINVSPSSVFQGGSASITPALINNDEVRYTVTLLESAGPFNVGNIMLFLQDNDDPSILIPYLYGVLPVPVPKYQSNPPVSIGNRLVFNLIAKYVNVSQAFTLQVVAPDYASLPSYTDDTELPPAASATYQQAVLQNMTRTGTPAIVMRREMDNSWFVDPFLQRLDDPNFGALAGGIAGDRYLPFLGPYYSGGLYPFVNASFNDTLDGGADWAVPGEADLPVSGGDYATS